MKFQFKAMFIACSLFALPVSAAMDTGATGNSSVILTIVQSGAKAATYDLGISYSDLFTLQNRTWNINDLGGGNTALSNFTSPAAQYGVYASDYSLSSGYDRISFITTVKTAAATGIAPSAANFNALAYASMTNSALDATIGSMDAYIRANNSLASHTEQANGVSYVIDTGSLAFGSHNAAYGTAGKINGEGSDTNVSLGSYLTLVQVSQSSSNVGDLATVTKIGTSSLFPTFFLSTGGTLTYTGLNQVAAVPESDPFAMVIAGLGLIGLVARRRSSNRI